MTAPGGTLISADFFGAFFRAIGTRTIASAREWHYDRGNQPHYRNAPASRRAFRLDWLQILRRETHCMPREGDTLRIPMKESELLAGLLKVKPTAEMPRPGANPTEPKKRKRKALRPGKQGFKSGRTEKA
jgi:hypothetical protein